MNEFELIFNKYKIFLNKNKLDYFDKDKIEYIYLSILLIDLKY